MTRAAAIAYTVVIGAALGAEPTPDDFELAVGLKGPTTVTVYGSWQVDGIQGWSWGLCHDAERASISEWIDDGADYVAVNAFEDGITQEIILDLEEPLDLPGTWFFRMLSVIYECRTEDPIELAFCDTLGTPPVPIAFFVDGVSYTPAVLLGRTLSCVPSTLFIRGDRNADGQVDLGDAVFILLLLFQWDPWNPVPCQDAADANDDGAINIADVIAVLSHLFGGSGPLPPPFPACGIDFTDDSLDCESYDPCADE